MQSSVCACRGCHGHGSTNISVVAGLQNPLSFPNLICLHQPRRPGSHPTAEVPVLSGWSRNCSPGQWESHKEARDPACIRHPHCSHPCLQTRPAPGKPRDSAWGVLKPFYNFFLFFKSQESFFGNGFSWCCFAAVYLQGMGILPHVQECTTYPMASSSGASISPR